MLSAIGCTAPASRSADPQPTASQPNSSRLAQPSLDGPTSRPASMLKPMNPKLIAAQTRFSLNLFSTVHKKDPKKNLFISPISISQAIAMIYNGAAAETQTAIGAALALEDLSLDDFNSANEDLRNALEYPGKDIQLSIANSIWTNQDTPISPNFIRRNQQFYNAKVESLDFNNKKSIGIINNWVKHNTQG
ncbi:MAG: serpin family protein, partial [Alkalinema sp. CAN_BIN05]|nr:serpin family protein [Alkalinema sp. CAN_BIN05]